MLNLQLLKNIDMRHAFTHILTALSLIAVMSLTSCEKEAFNLTPESGITQSAWTLSAGSLPAYDKDGGETAFTVTLATNIPSGDLAVESDAWIGAAIADGTLSVTLQQNRTTELRTGTVSVKDTKGRVQPAVLRIDQDWILVNKEGMVPFKDKAFKKHMLTVADTDKDGDISPEEAGNVEIIDINGMGVKDLSGLECFPKVWKLDAGNNDIEDAMVVSELHYLHWLNLKGNKNLKCFDVRGCTSYFEVCDFEVTEDLNYYLHYRYMGVTWPDDKNCLHSHHSRDPRLTQDWSREGECYEVYHHTKGPGKVAIVFSGIGWIDVDVNDGTFERIIHEGIEELKKQPEWKENWEYFDVYVMIHMAEKRCQWMYWDEMTGQDDPEIREKKDAYNAHRKALWEQMEQAVSNKYCYKITIDSHTNMKICGYINNFPEWCNIAPIQGKDNQTENYYGYMTVQEAMTMKNFPLGTGNSWTDWKDFD